MEMNTAERVSQQYSALFLGVLLKASTPGPVYHVGRIQNSELEFELSLELL